MKFGEKLKKLREENKMTQTELSEKVGVSLRTIRNYETGDRYPKQRELYNAFAEIFHVDVNYLLTEGENFVIAANEAYGYNGMKQAERLIADAKGLFAGGELSDYDKLAVMNALQQAFIEAKEDNKKYIPNKYKKSEEE